MWFMGHIMAVSGPLAEKGEQAVSDHFGGKKPAGDCSSAQCHLSLCPQLFHCVSPRLFLSDRQCSAPVPPPFTSISSSLSSLLSFFQWLPSAFPRSLSTVFHWAVRECCSECGYARGFASAVTVIFPLFLLCVGGLIPFSHCISTCWGNRAALLHFFFFFLNEVFVTGK